METNHIPIISILLPLSPLLILIIYLLYLLVYALVYPEGTGKIIKYINYSCDIHVTDREGLRWAKKELQIEWKYAQVIKKIIINRAGYKEYTIEYWD